MKCLNKKINPVEIHDRDVNIINEYYKDKFWSNDKIWENTLIKIDKS